MNDTPTFAAYWKERREYQAAIDEANRLIDEKYALSETIDELRARQQRMRVDEHKEKLQDRIKQLLSVYDRLTVSYSDIFNKLTLAESRMNERVKEIDWANLDVPLFNQVGEMFKGADDDGLPRADR